MKKILILFLLLIAINAQGQGLPVAANSTLASLFPDENLRVSVAGLLEADANLIGQALSDALAGIEVLEASNRCISNADGIEYLIGLIKLELGFNQIRSINVSNLINLRRLDLTANSLTTLDVSKNTNLIHLFIEANSLTTLDLSKNASLTYISIFRAGLTREDIIGHADLNILH